MTDESETDGFSVDLINDRQYRILVESVTDYAIYMLDPRGVVSSWNAGAQRFNGYTSAEIIGRNFSIFYTPEDQVAGEPERTLATAVREGRFESEGRRVRKDGTVIWASVVVDPLHEGGQLIGFAKITRDISERKEAERTLQEANAALLQSQKMEAVGQLTGGIAHDFNNLLAAVLGSLELLRKRLPVDATAVRLLDNAVQGAQRGTALTERMLAFARRQDVTPDVMDLSKLIRDMAVLMQPALGPAITVETRLPLKAIPVLVDANQLEMALLNLSVNARDAMPDGGVIVIDVREDRLAAGQVHGLGPGDYACLSVKDAGVGMDEATLARAAEPFYSTKGPGQGTGLGLSMVHGMAIAAGGGLILKSELGRGSVAELWLPLTRSRLAEGEAPGSASGQDAGEPKCVVLAVDDDSLVLLNTVMMLEDLGHKVFEANSGKRALELLSEEPAISLVVTDIAMPNMSGLQLVGLARKLYPDLRFVLVSGYSEVSDLETRGLQRLKKPFQQADLARAIQVTLGAAAPGPRVVTFSKRAARKP